MYDYCHDYLQEEEKTGIKRMKNWHKKSKEKCQKAVDKGTFTRYNKIPPAKMGGIIL